ncbi:MAG: DUF3866 family protein [Bacillota bacterium]
MDLEDGNFMAVFYPSFTGSPGIGERVLLNTTAVDLRLGTGGCHFIQARERSGEASSSCPGHIMKLRYTPWQFPVLSVEEGDSPWHDRMVQAESIAGVPVVVGTLHSQLIPVILGWRMLDTPGARIVFCMTDGAALPAQFSETLRILKSEGLLQAVVTVGQAFGGDLEAVNIYSGLIAARHVAGADLIVVGMGPGIVGTGTPYGFSGIEQGINVDAAANLDGYPIAVPRVSFADARQRHYGVSEHTLVALGKACSRQALVLLPDDLDAGRKKLLQEKISVLADKHKVVFSSCREERLILEGASLPLSSMGRTFRDDPYFFITACLAGRAAAEIWKGLRQW